ncbi:hypothetical protein [Knoellia sp. LjRoot47]|uniref:hypothetical protein n=1 Tax=Knoellia sp. LjRoot47 TaxID=3342330 RepID=UPI003ED012E6
MTTDPAAYAVDLRPRHRSTFVVTTAMCSWDLVVFRVEPASGGRPVFVAKPGEEVPSFVAALDRGELDEDLVRALRRPPRRRLVRAPRPRRGIRLGVEHEFVVSREEEVVDVRDLLADLDLGVRADPTDPRAQRCPWGGVVTADGREAEIATPAVVLGPGSPAMVRALTDVGLDVLATALRSRLEPEMALAGYSTHLNVTAPRRGARAHARRFASVFAPSLMLLLDRPTSPGLLVRPRPGRLELGGEFCAGTDLEVALTFAAGAVLASRGPAWARARRLQVEVVLEPARERYGWYVDRRAVGCDLYTLGREAPLRRLHTSTSVSAGLHLEQTWELARAALAGRLSAPELALVDAVVGGDTPLPRPQDGVASKT